MAARGDNQVIEPQSREWKLPVTLLPVSSGPRPHLLFVCGLVMLLAAETAVLFGNGYPILIYDTERFNPAYALTTMASVLPSFLNAPLFRLFGSSGAVISGMLATAYGVTRIVVAVVNRLQLQGHEALAVLSLVCLFSFVELYAIMIGSEPFVIAFFCVVLSILIDRKLNLLDIVVAAMTAATHAANLPLAIIFSLWAVVLGFRPRLVHVVVMSAAIATSLFVDGVLYRHYGPDEERLSTAYVGAQILSVFPFVLDEMCAGDPAYLLCREPYRSHIAAQTQTAETRRDDAESCGQNSAAEFLWSASTLLSRWGSSALPPEAQLSHADFNRLSVDLVIGFFTALPAHFSEVAQVTTCRLRFGLAMRGWRPTPPEWIPLTSESWVERRGFLLSPDDRATYAESCFGSGRCQSDRAASFYRAIVFTSYVLLIPSLWLAFSGTRDRTWPRLILFFSGAFLLNAFFMFNVSNFSPRYAYRLFFLITMANSLGLLLAIRTWRSSQASGSQ